MNIVYGIDSPDKINYYVSKPDEVLRRIEAASQPATYLVDIIPARASERASLLSNPPSNTSTVKHIPTWMPGATFHRVAAQCRQLIKEMLDQPFQAVKDKLVSCYLS
jgi:hypothetical protein